MNLFSKLRALFRRKQRSIVDGTWGWTVYNADGSIAAQGTQANMWPTAALNDILNVYYNAATQRTAWFMGLIDNAGFSALAATDTMGSHGGWNESTAYSAATRPVVTFSSPSGGQIASAAAVTFAINGSVSVKGAFLSSDSTKGGSTGQLAATGLLGSLQTLSAGQTLALTYTGPLLAT